jgi:hypothetical protein
MINPGELYLRGREVHRLLELEGRGYSFLKKRIGNENYDGDVGLENRQM